MNRFWIILILIVFTISCKSTQNFYNKKGELKNITDTKLINSIEDNYTIFNTIFYKKFKAEVAFNGENKSFKGNLFLTRDTSIIISINPLMGIELFRVKLSPDSVEIIDRTRKNYSIGNYEFLWDKFLVELDYQTVQNIIVNELYTYPISDKEDRYIKRYKHYISNENYQLKSLKDGRIDRKYKKDKTDELVLHEFSILPEIFKISNTYIKDFSVNSEINISYKNFSLVNYYYMPTIIDIKGKRGNHAFSINIEFEHIEINGDNAMGFKVSNKYDKIKL